jgi:two-component system response regulator AtoC
MDDRNNAEILVVDDEENLRHMMKIILSREGYHVFEAENGLKALDIIRGNDNLDLILCDIRMPEMDGMTLIKKVAPKDYHPIFVMMSAYGTIETAVSSMKMGAYDYISKPFQPDEILLTIRKALEHRFLREENVKLRRELNEATGLTDRMIGKSEEILRLKSLIMRVSQYDSTVLITGESGTGKELVARSIHAQSSRAGKAFVPINCSALPEGLLESELFGFRKGAFTDARKDKKGLIEEAHGGTLFLDEIADLPQRTQVKLLRFLQDGRIRRLGETFERKVDVRVVSATNQDLEKEVRDKRFREDLYFRLNVVRLVVPPLRERREDIPILAWHFAKAFSEKHAKPVSSIDPAVIELFMAYPWEGNIRELENVMERAVLFADGQTISAANLSEELTREVPLRGHALEGPMTLKAMKRAFEKEIIQKTLTRVGGDKKRASRELGITLRSLQYKLREYRGV